MKFPAALGGSSVEPIARPRSGVTPVSAESTAKKVFKDVRKVYEAGFKSANKTYDDDGQHIS